MAGEITKSAAVTNGATGVKINARRSHGYAQSAIGTHAFAAATELELADTKILEAEVPSNAIVTGVSIQCEDMDTHACPTLTLSVGVAAINKHTSVTSGVKTTHLADAVIDDDILVNDATSGQAAKATWTAMTLVTSADNGTKELWQLLGYDEDPNVVYRVCLTSSAAAAALGAAATCNIKVDYLA